MAGYSCLNGAYLKPDLYLQKITEEELLPTVKKIKEEIKARFTTLVGTDQRKQNKGFVLYYVFANDEKHEYIVLALSLQNEKESFPSITNYLPAANWFEREIQDLFGLKVKGHPNPTPLVLHGFKLKAGFPLRKDVLKEAKIGYINRPLQLTEYENDEIVQVPVGPIHAGIIEPGHFRFGTIGENVLHLDAQLFYTHRGIEKGIEDLTVEEGLPVVERICGVDVVSHALSYVQAVEKIGNINVPIRAQYLRTIYLELERFYNHVGDVGNLGAGVGFALAVQNGGRLKERLLRINQKYLGHRYLRDVIAIGGVKKGLTNTELNHLLEELTEIYNDFGEMAEIMMQHEIVLNRMKTTGILTKNVANDLETVGIAARASGRAIDIRSSFPHDAYKNVDFQVVQYEAGDVWARAMVRIDELRESLKIVGELIKGMPEGEIRTDYGVLPAYEWALGATESARGENIFFLMVGENNKIERLRVRSAPYMNWPAVPFTVPGNIIPDFPLINKSFELCYACCDR